MGDLPPSARLELVASSPSGINVLTFLPINFFYVPSAFQEIKGKTSKTIILPVLLYGSETWSLTLREEHKLRVFENKYLGTYLELRETKLQGMEKVT